MNTERDNFYDWAKDKTDTTRAADLRPSPVHRRPQHDASPWKRLALFALLVVALSVAYRVFNA
ncbi:hypothetical protein [Variovorax guangxiensis]|uniref:Uncharacterized protein n=1 Tax=Variovorax guangxiensis TaxID=1775474 RepID=A0A502DKK7_9BURK|nr:hypothetical protein [Variovorax guangxiensis]RZI65125.1 MAG: hypothetical protein EOP79_12560 [Variovorax sp.]TPG22129.1 hypothetical protein EAH83_16140 [Variovorax ginsengisoli]TPG26017.1 hypothetical protein EAH82_16625 [Variovorax guangxiensis]